MKKVYSIFLGERWPTMHIQEEPPKGRGYIIPKPLMERFERAHKELDDVERAIANYTGYPWNMS
jgi:hypothetical protein